MFSSGSPATRGSNVVSREMSSGPSYPHAAADDGVARTARSAKLANARIDRMEALPVVTRERRVGKVEEGDGARAGRQVRRDLPGRPERGRGIGDLRLQAIALADDAPVEERALLREERAVGLRREPVDRV